MAFLRIEATKERSMTDYGYSLGDTYTGARATPDLVGRDFELAEIYPAIEDT